DDDVGDLSGDSNGRDSVCENPACSIVSYAHHAKCVWSHLVALARVARPLGKPACRGTYASLTSVRAARQWPSVSSGLIGTDGVVGHPGRFAARCATKGAHRQRSPGSDGCCFNRGAAPQEKRERQSEPRTTGGSTNGRERKGCAIRNCLLLSAR